jgi:hypothetical protein
MATVKIPYLTARVNRDGSRRFYWQPSAVLRSQGWAAVPLGTDEGRAIAEARRINGDLKAWRRGQRPLLTNDNRTGGSGEDRPTSARRRTNRRTAWHDVLDRRAREIANGVRGPKFDPERR